MPTMPASVGTSVGKNGKLASLPRTKNTVSPTPAPTESTATSGRPTSFPSTPIGCTSSSVVPSNAGSLRVATTSPITRASCMAVCLFRDVDGIDDADYAGIDRRVFHARRHARRAAADDQYRFADAGVDGIDRDEIVAFGLAFGIDGPGQQQLVADQPGIFSRRDDGPDDTRK